MKEFVFAVVALLVSIVPLVFSPKSSELFEFPKLLIIYFGASLLLPLLIYKAPKLWRLIKKPKFKGARFFWLATLLFLFSQIISALFSLDQHVSFFGYYSRFNGGLLSLICYFVIMTSIVLFFSKEAVLKLLKTVLLSGILVALWGLPSRFGYDLICLLVLGKLNTSCWTSDFVPQLRLFSTLGQPNWLATYLLVLIFVVLYFFITGHSWLPKKVKQYSTLASSVVFLLFTVELVWTNSRSGILTYIIFVPLLLFVSFFLNSKYFKNRLKVSYFISILGLVFVGLSLLSPLFSKLQSLIITTKTTVNQQKMVAPTPSEPVIITPSSQIRLIVWQGAWELSKKYPWFGTGVETFAYAYNFTRPIAHNLTSEWNFVYNKAHNEFLNYLATTGWFGLVTYLIMIVGFLLPAITIIVNLRNRKNVGPDSYYFACFYFCSMMSILMMNFFGFSTTMTSLFFYLLPALWLVYWREDNVTTPINNERSLTKELSFSQLSLYFVWLLFIFVYLLNYYAADFNYARAREYKQIQDFTNAYIYGQKALDLRLEPTYLDQQAGITANLAALQQIQRNSPQAKQFTTQAIDYNNQALKSSPKNVYYYKTRAKIYYALSMSYIDNPELSANYLFQAIQALEVAQNLAPTDPIIPYTLAGLIQHAEQDKALIFLKTALKLKPDYLEAKELLKQLQIN